MIEAESIKYNLQNLPQLVFEVTDACNLRCEYCGYASLYEGCVLIPIVYKLIC